MVDHDGGRGNMKACNFGVATVSHEQLVLLTSDVNTAILSLIQASAKEATANQIEQRRSSLATDSRQAQSSTSS